MACGYCRLLLSTWVKDRELSGSELLIASACLPFVNPGVFEELSRGKVVLLACPEREGSMHYGKIASMIRSSRPRRITVATIDGSPHCFTLHASVNEAEYILGESVDREHYVVVGGEKLVRVRPDAVRVARYLSLVEKLLSENPRVLRELESLSREYALSRLLEKSRDRREG